MFDKVETIVIARIIVIAIFVFFIALVGGFVGYNIIHLQTMTKIEILEKTCRNLN